ncbi:peptidase M15 [Candidatus Poribacteria bacterium]|nr:peptidase M15 [Candidatus Poribacteria bacterium]
MRITKNFRVEEFECPCCGGILDTLAFRNFVVKLQDARDTSGIPFVITSGYRCFRHNKRIGGNSDSSHLKGIAADILTRTSSERYFILKSLIKAGFNRIGIGKNYIHADLDTDKPQFLIWTY